MEWFENVERRDQLPPEQFAYSMLTRSQRISHENLRLRDAGWSSWYERWFAGPRRVTAPARRRRHRCSRRSRARWHAEEPRRRLADGAVQRPTACPATPPPRAPRRARAGRRRAGVGRDDLRVARRRITPGCPGLWNDAQAQAWKRIVDFVHRHSRRQDRHPARPRRRQKARRACPGRAGRPPAGRAATGLLSASPAPTSDGQVPRAR